MKRLMSVLAALALLVPGGLATADDHVADLYVQYTYLGSARARSCPAAMWKVVSCTRSIGAGCGAAVSPKDELATGRTKRDGSLPGPTIAAAKGVISEMRGTKMKAAKGRALVMMAPVAVLLSLAGCGNGGDAQELHDGEVWRVNCDAGETIAGALSQALANDTIAISGMCQERVVVNKDGITLDGGGSAVIDGGDGGSPVILVKGRQNVTIKGVTVRNGLIGLHADGGAAVELDNVTAQDNLLTADRSNDSDGSGVVVSRGSTAMLRGGRISGNQGKAGLIVTSGSTVVASGLTVENNALQGIGVYKNSFVELRDCLVRGRHERYAIQVWSRSAAELSGVTSTGNAGDGLAVSSDSYVDLEEGTITDNGGRGVLAQRGVYVEIADSTITGNATDLDVSTLSRIGWEATAIDTIDCDDSVLTFLDAACPE